MAMVSAFLRRVLIDTNVLLFGLSPLPELGIGASQKERYALEQGRNARGLLAQCRAEGAPVFVSSISVGEVLEGAPEAEAQDVYAVLISLFPTLPLDNACVYVAAAYARALRRLDVQDSADKTKLRNDLYILATGVQNGCTDFYTTDKILLKQAARLAIPMRVHSLATVA